VVSLDISATHSFRPHHSPGVDSAPSENEYQEHFLGVKAAGALGWQPYHLNVPSVMEIWEPKPPGTLWATLGLLRDCFTFFMLYNQNTTSFFAHTFSHASAHIFNFPTNTLHLKFVTGCFQQCCKLKTLYRVSQEECAILRESVPYVKLYRYNPKHLYPKLNGYGDNGQISLKLWQLLHTYWLPHTYWNWQEYVVYVMLTFSVLTFKWQ